MDITEELTAVGEVQNPLDRSNSILKRAAKKMSELEGQLTEILLIKIKTRKYKESRTKN
jgi:hypothetical protein